MDVVSDLLNVNWGSARENALLSSKKFQLVILGDFK